MVFDSILGQEPAVATLRRALERGRVHHAYRFEGPDGVGKERVAFALAQSLLCTGPGAVGCGQCSACVRAIQLNTEEPHTPLHPDVLLVQRGLYPPAILGATSRESSGIGVEQIRRIVLGRAAFPPHEGRALVVLIRDAHELTTAAANAMLKTLEEPPRPVHFVLLTSQPNRLLDTIRSRTLAVRFGPLAQTHIETILRQHSLPTDVAPLAQGSAALALQLSDSEQLQSKNDFVAAALDAANAPDLASGIALAAASPSDRLALRELLEFLAQKIALSARQEAVAGADADKAAQRYGAVVAAVSRLERNAQPGLVVEHMIRDMRA